MLLLWACLIWVLPKSRAWCLRSSPLFVTYSLSLLTLEFIYGLDLNVSELLQFKEIGLIKHEVPIIHLSIKTGLILSLLLTLKQFITEKKEAKEALALQQQSQQQNALNEGGDLARSLAISNRSISSDNNNNAKSYLKSTVANWIYTFLIKYWIFLSSATLLLMSCQNDVVAYRIGYMALFLYFITTFQVFLF